MKIGVVLVHGYSGAASDLDPLAEVLRDRFGHDAVRVIPLPGHENGAVPPFDEALFKQRISEAVAPYREEGRRLVLAGHSTGGPLLVSLLADQKLAPALLVLLAAPKRIDTSYLERWTAHRSGRDGIPFGDIAAAISFINRSERIAVPGSFPVLAVHGTADDLVPVRDAHAWERGTFRGSVRVLVIPGAAHHLVRGPGSSLAIDAIVRAVADAAGQNADASAVDMLVRVEPDAAGFVERHPLSKRHLAYSASGLSVVGKKADLAPLINLDPVFANIEVTTRCNLSCGFCARSFRSTAAEDMPVERFKQTLALLPHAYRVQLVGLGEPLLHPKLADLISLAAKDGRRTGLVTNAMLLDEECSRELLDAGLGSIAFSIDAAEQDLASELRAGTDLEKVVRNIKAFMKHSRSTRPISTAVFTAVSTRNIRRLDSVVDLVASLGVHVMMMTDLNFAENGGRTLWKNADAGVKETVRNMVSRAFSKQIPVLSVHGLEEFGLMSRYRQYLLLPPDGLFQRSAGRTWCSSPWQTIPVNVRGEVTVCDCQPDAVAGNLWEQPFGASWNGRVMQEHRAQMLSDDPPAVCRLCPRF